MANRQVYDDHGRPLQFTTPNQFRTMEPTPCGLSVAHAARLRAQILESGPQVFELEAVPYESTYHHHQQLPPPSSDSSGGGVDSRAVLSDNGYYMGPQYPGMAQYDRQGQTALLLMEQTQQRGRGGQMLPPPFPLQERGGRFMSQQMTGQTPPQSIQHQRQLQRQMQQMQQLQGPEPYPQPQGRSEQLLQHQGWSEHALQPQAQVSPYTQHNRMATPALQRLATSRHRMGFPAPYPQAESSLQSNPYYGGHTSELRQSRLPAIANHRSFEPAGYRSSSVLDPTALSYTPGPTRLPTRGNNQATGFHNHTLPRSSHSFETIPVENAVQQGVSIKPSAQRATCPAPVAVMQAKVDSPPATITPTLPEKPATKPSRRVARLGRCRNCIKRHKKCLHIAAPMDTSTAPHLPDKKSQTVGDLTNEDLSSAMEPLEGQTLDEELLALVPDSSATGSSLPREIDTVEQQPFKAAHSPPDVALEDTKFKKLTKPKNTDGSAVLTAHFLNKLNIRLGGRSEDPTALATFDRDMELYKAKAIEGNDFYVRIYMALARGDSLDLLPDFHKLVHYGRAELIHMKNKAELELAKEIAVPQVTRKSTRKTRPINALKGSESIELGEKFDDDAEETAGEDSADDDYQGAPDCAAPRRYPDSSARQDSSSDSEDAVSGGQDVKSTKKSSSKSRKASSSGKDKDTSSSKNKKSTSSRTNKKSSSSGTNNKSPTSDKVKKRPSTKTGRLRKSVRGKRTPYGHLLAAEVPHVGPVYPDRRQVLRRESNPYVHFCGRAFPHPQDVRAHHRDAKCFDGPADSRSWSEHPSCSIDYPDISYAKVADGYVILDQASQDRLDAANAIGEAWTDRTHHKLPKCVPEKELVDDAEEESNSMEVRNEGEMDSGQDAEYELEEDYGDQAAGTMVSSTSVSSVDQLVPATIAAPPSTQRKRAASNLVGGPAKKTVLKINDNKADSFASAEKTVALPDLELFTTPGGNEITTGAFAVPSTKVLTKAAAKSVKRSAKSAVKAVNDLAELPGPATMVSKRPIKPGRVIVKAGPD